MISWTVLGPFAVVFGLSALWKIVDPVGALTTIRS